MSVGAALSKTANAIPREELRAFKVFLLPSFQGPFYQAYKDRPWRRVPKKRWSHLTDDHLLGHLGGKFVLGYPGKAFTKFCAVDIDRHRGEPDSVIFAQAEQVIGLFDEATPVVVQSSASGGIHVYFFFAQAGWSNRATAFVKEVLSAEGLSSLEVYPAGTKNFRLPFGEHSLLLDPTDFTPLCSTNIESFRRFLWDVENEKIEPLEIPAEYRANQTPFRSTQKRRKLVLGASTSPFMRDIDLLLSEGLQPSGALSCLGPDEPQHRNKQLWLLTWYQKVVERKSDADTRGHLKWWIEKKHNGLSKDFPAEPEKVYAEIGRIVENFEWSKVDTGLKTPSESPRRDLNHFRAQIAGLDLMDSQCEFLACFLQYAEARGTQTENGVLVEVPVQTLKEWARKKRYQPPLKSLIKAGYLEIASGYQIGKCRTFRVNLSAAIE